MSGALYTRDILRLAVSIPNQRRLEKPHGSAEKRSRTCGSAVTADVHLDDKGKIADFGFVIKACALGQASAAILGQQSIGKTGDEIKDMYEALSAFLNNETALPIVIDNVAILAPAKEHQGRHAAILLPYEALVDACETAQNNMKAA